jgi:hypothetical protein
MINEISGYYSCSINPSYISTWYTSFKSKRRHDNTPRLFPEETPEESTISIPIQEPTGWEDFQQPVNKNEIPANLADNSHHGRISPIALRKIKKAIDYTVYLAAPKSLPNSLHGKDFKFRLNLITLTLSSNQIHSDNEIKKEVFQPMLNSFRDKFHVINYVWRAEKQGNGNIHFHIITDKFIPWNELRNTWNKHQNKLGYINRYRQNMIDFHKDGFKLRKELLKDWTAEKQIKAYKEGIKNEWHNPNSTDVHSLRTVTNVKNYFVKYLTKDTQSADNRENANGQYSNLDGRLWGCSSRLSNIKGARADLDNELTEELQKLTEDKEIRNFKSDFFAVTFIDIDQLIKKGFKVIPQLFEKFICETFPEYRPPNLFSSLN